MIKIPSGQLAKRLLIATIIILAVDRPAFASVSDADRCKDSVGSASASYWADLMSLANTCFAARASGQFMSVLNCFTDKADPAKNPGVTSSTALQKGVVAANSNLSKALTKRCAPEAADNVLSYLCVTNEGTYLTDTQFSCIVDKAHGASAARLQSYIYGDGVKLTDPAKSCQANVGKILTNLSEKIMKARRSFGRLIMAGKNCVPGVVCDPTKLNASIDIAMERARADILSSCSDTAVSNLTFGFKNANSSNGLQFTFIYDGSSQFCPNKYDTSTDAAYCLTGATFNEAWISSDLIYSTGP
jgi:hypothetical protein